MTKTTYYKSELGLIKIEGDKTGITYVNFTNEKPKKKQPVPSELKDCHAQIHEYFQGKRKTFKLKLKPVGTDFQMKVWKQLEKIPFGKTNSYQDVAIAIKNPKAVRAVGLANGKNPISIIIPCHRVIGKDGSLTGYGGGLDKKEWLLDFESK